MATIDDRPADTPVYTRQGDGWSHLFDFDIVLTGYTFAAQVWWGESGSEVQAITITNTDLSTGKITLSLTAAQTAAMPIGTYPWRLQWTPSGGLLKTVIGGMFHLGDG